MIDNETYRKIFASRDDIRFFENLFYSIYNKAKNDESLMMYFNSLNARDDVFEMFKYKLDTYIDELLPNWVDINHDDFSRHNTLMIEYFNKVWPKKIFDILYENIEK